LKIKVFSYGIKLSNNLNQGTVIVIKLINKPCPLNIVYYVYMSKLYIFTNDL
tara:strand:+ start:380 stop:535 length:156 start_codon:yes stop_codon:yes gene_type:complete